MKVLVTGAGGFIGSHLVKREIAQGNRVSAVDLHFNDKVRNAFNDSVDFFEGDFREATLISQALEGCEIAYHLASAHLQQSISKPEYWNINVHSLEELLERCRKAEVKRFVHVSSVGIYGNIEQPPADEETEPHPQSVYGETKLAGEKVVREFYEKTGFPVTIIRPTWVYGPGCPRTQKLLRSLEKGRFLMIGGGKNFRHCIYIDDLLDGFSLASQNEKAIGETFILGDSDAVTVKELINTICEVIQVKPPRLSVPLGLAHVMALLVEKGFDGLGKEPPISRRRLEFFDTNQAFKIDRAVSKLGFQPNYDLKAGMQAAFRWLKNCDVKNSE